MQSWWSRRVAALAAAMLVAPLLAACGDGDDPADEGTPTPKFSEAPSSSAGSADASASASGSGSAEAAPQTPKQVARAFVKAVGESVNTGEPREFLQYTNEECSNCETVAVNVANLYKNGRSARSQGWSVKTLKRDEARGDLVFLSGDIDASSQELLRSDGSVYKRESAAIIRQELRLERSGDRWIITGWNIEQ